MLVTTKLLKKMEACSNQVKLFKKLYPQGIDIFEDHAKAQKVYDEAGKAGLDIGWWLEKMKLTGAVRWWYPDGKLQYEIHCQNGECQDFKDGTPAVRQWYFDGTPERKIHYRNGERHDPKDGTAAVKRWYFDGKPECELHCQDGILQDPKDGSPAERWWYPNGKPKCEIHYQNGVRQC